MKTIDDLQKLIGSLALTPVQGKKLNMAAGGAMKRVIRANIRAQKDIHGKPFKARKNSTFVKAASGKISLNKKMFEAARRILSQEVHAQGVDVGYSGNTAKVLGLHNRGEKIAFKHRLGWRTEYRLPKREFIGWSPDMVKEVKQSIVDQYLKFQGV